MFPDITFNGENYLVCWEDRRDYPYHIFYTTVTPSGQVTSTSGINISAQDPSDYNRLPAVASNSHNYLVAWISTRLSGDIVSSSRVNTNGDIIDSIPFELSSDSFYINQIAAGSNQDDYLVVWTGQKMGASGMNLYFRRFSSDAVILDTSPIIIAQHTFGIYDPVVSFGGGCYLIVWSCDDNIYGCRILPNGTVLDSGGFIICADLGQQIDPSVASDGHRFLVTWTDGRTGNYDIYATFVDSAGNVGLEENNSATIINSVPIDISPVPFTNKVNIKFNLPGQNNIELNIYDVFGRLVKSFTNPQSPAHNNNIIWDGTDSKGFALPNGTYFCRLRADSISVTKRIVKLKK